MTRTIIVGSAAGLLVSAAILVLLASGVAGVLIIGSTDLMYFLWPAALMLTNGWRTSLVGFTITAAAVVLNCLTYIAAGLLLRALSLRIKRL